MNYGTIGSAILWLPFYAVADVLTRVTGVAATDGFSKPYIAAVAYGSAFYGFLAILLSIRAARVVLRHETRGSSALAGLAIWIGTPLLFYMYVAPPFAHACSAFAVALFVNVWLHVRNDWSVRGAFALGLSAALMAMVREQDAFIASGAALDFVWTALQRRSALRSALAGVFGLVIGFMPQLLAYNALNGYPGPARDVSRKMYWYSPHGLQVLASPNHGFFFWTPLAVIAIAGLFIIRDIRVRIALLVMVASQVYVAGSVDSWTVAGAFGQRRFVCVTAVLVIGLAALWDRIRGAVRTPGRLGMARHTVQVTNGTSPNRRRLVFAVAVVLCVWWNVALMLQFATRLMDRQRLEPARNAYHAFVTLPLSAPSLAYRYLTDRESFYEPRNGGAIR